LLSEDVLEKYRKAGRIAAETREITRRLVREGMPIINLCEEVENYIRQIGGKPAFPCNVCINEITAHYTSPPGDTKTIPEGAVVKVDIGVQVDGYIADTALTICFDPEYEALVYSAEEALHRAIQAIKPGIRASEIGTIIQRSIEVQGLKPIWNLTGHQIARYIIHTGKSLPNVAHLNGMKLEVDEVYAIEPFVTVAKAAGEVREADEAYIYRVFREKPPKEMRAKRLFEAIKHEFKTLPFAKRWLGGISQLENLNANFSVLLKAKNIVAYPVLVEKTGKVVAQAEHTLIVTKNGCEVTTL
jgi:methionyl aminopeptidase